MRQLGDRRRELRLAHSSIVPTAVSLGSRAASIAAHLGRTGAITRARSRLECRFVATTDKCVGTQTSRILRGHQPFGHSARFAYPLVNGLCVGQRQARAADEARNRVLSATECGLSVVWRPQTASVDTTRKPPLTCMSTLVGWGRFELPASASRTLSSRTTTDVSEPTRQVSAGFRTLANRGGRLRSRDIRAMQRRHQEMIINRFRGQDEIHRSDISVDRQVSSRYASASVLRDIRSLVASRPRRS